MPHRSADQPPARGSYSPQSVRGGRSYPPPPAVHMIHHSEAARMAAYQRAQQTAYGGVHPAYHGHHMPPPMWHPADAAAHLTRAEMGLPDAAVSHARGASVEIPPTKRLRSDTMESAEEAAASALLMASAMRKPDSEETQQQGSAGGVSREPLKKRKHFQVDTKIDPATGTPCHVSPGSAASSADGDGRTDESVTIVTQSSRTFLEASSGSYDTRETKKDEPPHFPSVLHKVLDMPEVRSVLQWLPHGEAWKIVRWDALRREVLPRYFPELCKGKEEGSMDAFLGQVRAWGFEEVIDGPDAGAYQHVSFVRGTPKLCKHMTCKETAPKLPADNVESHGKGPKSQEASILQVPSLTSRSDGEQEPKEAAPERQEPSTNKSSSPSNMPNANERRSPIHPGWQHGAMSMSYRTHDGGYADPRLVHQSSPLRHGVTFPPPYSPRFPFRTPGGPPSPLLKSGRGGFRSSSRNSFPVSQRGKGGRHRIVRSPITTPNSEESSLAKNESEEPQSPPDGFGPHLEKSEKSQVQEEKQELEKPKESKSTASGPTRKMAPRKLPLARKSVSKETPAVAASETSNVNEEGTPKAATAEF